MVTQLHFKAFSAILVYPPLLMLFDIRALWHSVMSARVPECQKIKNDGLDQYGAKRLGRIILPLSENVGKKGFIFNQSVRICYRNSRSIADQTFGIRSHLCYEMQPFASAAAAASYKHGVLFLVSTERAAAFAYRPRLHVDW